MLSVIILKIQDHLLKYLQLMRIIRWIELIVPY
ncbi:unnamed protein product [Onchocerca flexuosa]|uniref:Uncharacterized protein n=1 Tax=Onchocerca flexuosa TaxID=387005 RepID=A0A183HXA9_9BILA|nr:unnamed protein product [Onchocerca flexuosa]